VALADGAAGPAGRRASAALWLSSEHAGWITGEVLVVDGGSLLGSGVTPAG
jgi:3-oxoacyl-[acyl-carrier protein] reductase